MRGGNSDNTLIREQLGWEPSISLEDGLEKTYHWIHEQMTSGARDEAALVPGHVTHHLRSDRDDR